MQLLNKATQLKTTTLAATIAVSLSGAAHAVQYTVLDLGTLNGGPNATAVAIGNAGHVVGSSRGLGATTYQAFIYDGAMNNIGTLGAGTFVTGVNASGQATGYSTYEPGKAQAYIYDHTTGTIKGLGTLGGYHSHGWGINNAGHVVGSSNFDGYMVGAHAFLHDGTTMHDLGTLGGNTSRARAINDDDIVVGTSDIANSNGSHAFLYDGVMHDLGTLGGETAEAYDINNKGQVLGVSQLADGSSTSFIYHNGVMQELNAYLGVSARASSQSINNLGQMVGGIIGFGPFFYDGTTVHKLSDLLIGAPVGVTLGVVDINDAGQIAAVATFADGSYHAFQLNPVPIPATAWLFGSGLLGIAGMARRKSKLR
jgi:probable HAF family extracellular repeat protein